MNDMESLQAGLERDLQEYINDFVFTDSAQGSLDYHLNHDPTKATTQHYGTGDSSNNATNYSVLNSDSNSALQYQSLSKPLSRKKNSPSSSNQPQTKLPIKEKQSLKLSKAGTALSTMKDIVVKTEESDDDKSSVDSDDGKDDSFNMSKSRSSSIGDERGGGSDNDTSKRKFQIKKVDAQNAREKNREHAKNTRMRKKNYIESLKENIKQLTDEREQSDLKRKASLSKLADQVKIISPTSI